MMVLGLSRSILAQDLYFPTAGSDEWQQIDYDQLGWCQENVADLISLNENSNSKALIVLKGGKIAIEEYFGDHDVNKNWYWASAGKSLTACLVGIAQENGLLNIEDKTSEYLGDWTICNEANDSITIRQQMTMTTGLDYTQSFDCTDPVCLDCLNDPDSEWYYHNAPYTLIQEVIANASNTNYSIYTRSALGELIGMDGLWLPVGDNSIYFSTARSMARFGLFVQAMGDWDGNTIVNDKDYFTAMTRSSQDINKSYGYLWWLNGQESYRLPGSTITFSGSLVPNLPDDAFFALGKNGQYIVVVPSQDIVIVRMGDDPESSLVPTTFLIELIDAFNKLDCLTDVEEYSFGLDQLNIVNKICDDILRVVGASKNISYFISDRAGNKLYQGKLVDNEINVEFLQCDLYFISFYHGNEMLTQRFYKG